MGAILCSRCGKPRERKSHRYCRACSAAYLRAWRREHPLSEEQRRKDNCRSYANVYKRRGKLIPKSCRKCGGPAEMHHPDYTKPLLVVWLCRKHHLQLHRELAAQVARETFAEAA